MNKNAEIPIPGYNYEETKENPWVKNFPVKIELNPDNTLAGFSQPIRLEKIFNSYNSGSLKDETVEVTFGKEAILMLLS